MLFPLVPTETVKNELEKLFTKKHRDAAVYADFEQETLLYEGDVRLLTNGWVELPSGRLLSPEAVHHIDTK